MKRLLFKVFVLVFLIVSFQACNEPLVEDQPADEMELKSANSAVKSYIVVLNDPELNNELSNLKGYEKRQQSAKKAAEKIMKRAGITDGEVEHVYGNAIKGFSVKIAPGQLKKLQDEPTVKYIEEDQIVTLVQPDVKINKKPTKPSPTPDPQAVPWGIARVNGGTSISNATAWVIDTGIDLDHPDLNVDQERSKTYIARTTTADDDNGHGSHCAGIIAAKDNTEGVVGVAPGSLLVAVKVLDRRGSGTTSGVIAGVNYVASVANASDVANMSLGGGISIALDEAVLAASASCKFSLAAGNESDDALNHSPARVNGPNIYTISAMDSLNKFAYFSNFGTPVDYCEPGVSIYSCFKGGGYATMSGTSMAAPHATGLLLLGNIRNGGTVIDDPDGDPDIIGIH